MDKKIKEKHLEVIKERLTDGRGVNLRDGKTHFRNGTVYVEAGIEWIPRGFGYTLESAALQALENTIAERENREALIVA